MLNAIYTFNELYQYCEVKNMVASSNISHVAVLGAGVMGAQIAAHFANAGISTLLYDLKAKKGAANQIVEDALLRLHKLNPPPLASTHAIEAITPGNFEDDLDKLSACDLIVEAIIEDTSLKVALYKTISPYLKEEVIFCSNTSGISVAELAKGMPEALKKRFCGCHFFNPPRYLRLVELIAHQDTDQDMLNQLETFLTHNLGKSVVYAKDVPNFIANRIVTYGFFVACHYAKAFSIPLEVVDQLTGTKAGRPKSATFRTLDIVGLDTLGHVSNTFMSAFKGDAWSALYPLPDWLSGLIKEGSLGQKTAKGIYEKRKEGIYVLDLDLGDYRLADKKASAEVIDILKEADIATRFQRLHDSDHPEAQFLWACYRELFHYMACCTQDVADNVRDVDLAIKLGFAWSLGPYEIWQLAGFNKIKSWIEEDIKQGIAIGQCPLPDWLKNIDHVYSKKGAYNPTTLNYEPRKPLAILKKQFFAVRVLEETQDEGETLYEDQGVRLWHLGDDIAICSFKSKMNTMGSEIIQGLQKSIAVSEDQCRAMVIWQRHGDNFSVGANLLEVVMAVMQGGIEVLEPFIKELQETVLSMRYASIPVVAATKGYVFGGGCELIMHCDAVVASLESYIGLVEAGVGILPAGCGSKEMALRASRSVDPFKAFTSFYKNIAMAEVAKSALYAKEMGYLRDADEIVFHPDEVLYVAKETAKTLAINYRPPRPPKINVLGHSVIATIKASLVNLREGGFISAHDYLVASNIAYVICGGDLEKGEQVDENWFLALERKKFLELLGTNKTSERIQYTLETGKPLRN